MKIEVKITDDTGEVKEYILSDTHLTDEEIEGYAQGIYGGSDELWDRIAKTFVVGAKWARDTIKSRQEKEL